jgi:hypothetical protein
VLGVVSFVFSVEVDFFGMPFGLSFPTSVRRSGPDVRGVRAGSVFFFAIVD